LEWRVWLPQPKRLRERAGGSSLLHWASDFSMLARRWIQALELHQTPLKCGACALRPELLADVAARVDENVSHITASILLTGDDEVPGVTRKRMTRRISRVLELLCVTQGIAEDEEFLTCLELVYYRVVGGWSAPSVHRFRDVTPDFTFMIGHSFVNLLFSLLN